jgi:hypothetical protein
MIEKGDTFSPPQIKTALSEIPIFLVLPLPLQIIAVIAQSYY